MNEILADKRLGRAALYATILAVIALSLFLAARSLPARGAGQPADTLPSESDNYHITAEVLAEGGGGGDSANYRLFDTIGEAIESGLSTSANFRLSSGSIPALLPEGPPAHTNEITYPPDGTVTVAPSITVTGSTGAGAAVVISVGADTYATTAGSGGEYGVPDVVLTLGPNTINSESTDRYGNRATASVAVTRTTYLLTGTLASRIHDAGEPVSWDTISWQTDAPPGTSIVFRTRTGNSLTPDDTWSAWSEAYSASGQAISSPAGRYLQYQAAFSTADGMVSPALEEVAISYEPLAHTESRWVDPGDAPRVDFPSARLSMDCSAGPGGTVTVTLHNTDHPNPPSGIGVMSRYWDISTDFDGPFTCALTFTYDESDLNGAAEDDIAGAARWDHADARWTYIGGTVDTDANTVTLADVNAFSPWLLITSAPPQAVDDLNGTRSGSDLQLSWPAVMADILGNTVTPDYYVVYRRSDEAYFLPDAADIIATPAAPSYTDPGILGDPSHNFYYVVAAVDGDGAESALSNRLGAFGFSLVPAAQADERMYNLIALNVAVPGVSNADSLAGYVGGEVYMVLRYDAPTQSIVWRLPGLAGENFAVKVGEPYFLYLDDTAPGVLSLVGKVPSQDAVRFSLARPEPGGSCTYNFVSVPLHRDDLVGADGLAADIDGVYMAIRYNAATQDLTWRMPGMAGENFPVRAGYPYIVCLDETAPPNWP